MNILVPTDFSVYADYALNAAIRICEKLNATLHLYHSADIPDDWEDLSAQNKVFDTVNRAKALKVRDKFEQIKSRYANSSVEIKTHFTGGKFLKNIHEVTDAINFDLIVMGSHGASGKEEWFLGSNAQKVVRKMRHKVLVVKKTIESIEFQNALYVSGLEVADHQAFKEYLQFLEQIGCKKLHIMAVDTSGWFSQPTMVMNFALDKFKQIASDFDVETHFYSDYSVEAGIRHFTEEYKVDLIGISNHKRHPIKRFFQGSTVEIIVNNANVPVLSIDYV